MMSKNRYLGIFIIGISLISVIAMGMAESKPDSNSVIASVGDMSIKYRATIIPEEYSKGLNEQEIIQKKKERLASFIFYFIVLAEANERGIEVPRRELEQEADELIRGLLADPDFPKEMEEVKKMDPSAPTTFEEIRTQYLNSQERVNRKKVDKLKQELEKNIVVSEKEMSDRLTLLKKMIPKPKGSEIKICTFWHKDKKVIDKIKTAMETKMPVDEIAKKFKLYPDQGGGNRRQTLKWSKRLSLEYRELFYIDAGTELPIKQVKKDGKEFYQLRFILDVSGELPVEPEEELEQKAKEGVFAEKRKQIYRKLLKKWVEEKKAVKFYDESYNLGLEDLESVIK